MVGVDGIEWQRGSYMVIQFDGGEARNHDDLVGDGFGDVVGSWVPKRVLGWYLEMCILIEL